MKRHTQTKIKFGSDSSEKNKKLRTSEEPSQSQGESSEAPRVEKRRNHTDIAGSAKRLKSGMSMKSGGFAKRNGLAGSARSSRKLVIKNFHHRPSLPDNFEDVTWKRLSESVSAIHSKKGVSASLEELYKDVENLCTQSMARNLYHKLKSQCEAHIRDGVNSLLDQTEDKTIYLGIVDGHWKDHCQQMLMIRSVFLYLDRTFVLQSADLPSLWQLGLDAFRSSVLENSEVKDKVVNGILHLISREREGDAVDRSLLHSLLRMLAGVKMYTDPFEQKFIIASQDFYEKEGNTLVDTYDVPQFLKHVDTRLKQENDRVVQYLASSTRRELVSVVEKELLEKHAENLVEKGFFQLCDNLRIGDLSRMFRLYGLVSKYDLIRHALSKYVCDKGKLIVQDPSRDSSMVQDLLAFKADTDRIVTEAFCNNELLSDAVKESFEQFVNVRKNRPAEMIAKYVDHKLRSGNKAATEEELEATMENVMSLFRFIQGKDVFEAFYKKDLAKRLLLGKSASFDAEKSMISKLKAECGGAFTNKLEGMFKDIEHSSDIMRSYRDNQTTRGAGELNVHVLTMGNWPSYAPLELNLPSRLAKHQQEFTNFYLKKHQGRKLKWIANLGHCVVRGRFPKGNKELQVSMLQACVLLLFNNANELSYGAIKDATNVDENELKRTLQSLACAKVKVLTKSPKGRDVNPTDRFSYNREFTAKLIKIKVNQIQIKETKEEQEATQERVVHDRQYQVDAAIVRIMKARRSLSHQLLLSDVFQQLKFDCQAPDVKKRIESLIDREYLVRDKNDHQMYHYQA